MYFKKIFFFDLECIDIRSDWEVFALEKQMKSCED